MTDTPLDRRKESIIFGPIQRLTQTKFFHRREPVQGIWQTIAWWEARRIPYNLLVGAVGVVSGGLCVITGLLCEHFLGDPIGIPNPPIVAFFAVAAYGVMANLCYTGGWVAELVVRKIWPENASAFGQISFFLGLVFSMALTLVPGVLISLTGALRLLEHFMAK